MEAPLISVLLVALAQSPAERVRPELDDPVEEVVVADGESVPAESEEEPEPTTDPAVVDEVIRKALEPVKATPRPGPGAMLNMVRALTESRSMLLEAAANGSPDLRAMAIKILGEMGNEEDLALVVGGLSSPHSNVRLASIVALRNFPGRESSEAIAKLLTRERSPNLRRMAVRTMKAWGDPAALPELVKQLEWEPHEGVRRSIVRALKTLTKRDFGDDPARWARYVEARRQYEQALRILGKKKEAM